VTAAIRELIRILGSLRSFSLCSAISSPVRASHAGEGCTIFGAVANALGFGVSGERQDRRPAGIVTATGFCGRSLGNATWASTH
jgi:hypothetical protein